MFRLFVANIRITLAIGVLLWICGILYTVNVYSKSQPTNETKRNKSSKCVHREKQTFSCFIDDCVVTEFTHNSNRNQYVSPLSDTILPLSWKSNKINRHISKHPYSHFFHRPNNINIHTLRSVDDAKCYISHKFHFVFVHVKKSGGSSIIGFLTKALCQSLKRDDCDPEIFQKMKCRDTKHLTPKYFYFSFVRNPYDRAFSIFSHFFIKKSEIYNERNIYNYTRIELLNKFTEFMLERRQFGLNNSPQNVLLPPITTGHYYPQSWFLFNNTFGCPIVDFIGHIEFMETDIKYLIALLNNTLISNYYIKRGTFWKINTFGMTVKLIMYNNTQYNDGLNINSLTDIYNNAFNVKQIVHDLYESDFKLFGYDPKFIEMNGLHDL